MIEVLASLEGQLKVLAVLEMHAMLAVPEVHAVLKYHQRRSGMPSPTPTLTGQREVQTALSQHTAGQNSHANIDSAS